MKVLKVLEVMKLDKESVSGFISTRSIATSGKEKEPYKEKSKERKKKRDYSQERNRKRGWDD